MNPNNDTNNTGLIFFLGQGSCVVKCPGNLFGDLRYYACVEMCADVKKIIVTNF